MFHQDRFLIPGVNIFTNILPFVEFIIRISPQCVLVQHYRVQRVCVVQRWGEKHGSFHARQIRLNCPGKKGKHYANQQQTVALSWDTQCVKRDVFSESISLLPVFSLQSKGSNTRCFPRPTDRSQVTRTGRGTPGCSGSLYNSREVTNRLPFTCSWSEDTREFQDKVTVTIACKSTLSCIGLFTMAVCSWPE